VPVYGQNVAKALSVTPGLTSYHTATGTIWNFISKRISLYRDITKGHWRCLF